MIRFLIRRVLSWLVLIVVAINVTYFLAVAFLDPTSNYRNIRPAPTRERIDAALHPYNLDPSVPLVVRWWHWVRGVFWHFDWGRAPTGNSVNAEVGYRVLVSGQLVFGATVLSVLIGVGLGVVSAVRQYRPTDRILQGISVVLFNVPTAVCALGLVYLAISFNNAVGHRVFFVSDSSSPQVSGGWPAVLGDRLEHLILPTLSLTLLGYVGYHLTQRSLLLDTINADFVRTARATGLTYAQAIRRHALRASLIPTATAVAFGIPAIFTGAVLTETIFGWHGMGEYFILTIDRNDIHGVVAVAAFSAVMTAIGAILADIATVFLDPRVRISGGR